MPKKKGKLVVPDLSFCACRLQFVPDSDKNVVVTSTRAWMRSKCMSTKGRKRSDKNDCQAMMIAIQTRYITQSSHKKKVTVSFTILRIEYIAKT
jgi:hypothetical protein